jgi:hypothetical protein
MLSYYNDTEEGGVNRAREAIVMPLGLVRTRGPHEVHARSRWPKTSLCGSFEIQNCVL